MMKEYLKKGIAILLAIAAILSFAACGKEETATEDETQESTISIVEETEISTEEISTEEISTEAEKYVTVDFSVSREELQKQLLKLLPEENTEIFIQEDLSITREYGKFFLDTPYAFANYLGSADVPAAEGGWELLSYDECWWVEGTGTVKFSEENKTVLQCWQNQQLVWELDTEVEGLCIKEARGNVIILADDYYYHGDHELYIVHDQEMHKVGEDVLDIDARYNDLWWLTIDGKVYLLEDYYENPQGEAKLMATDAIALSNDMDDGPGWYIAGEASFQDDWAPIAGEFVPAP